MTSQLNVDTIVDKQGTGGPTVQSPTLTEMTNTSTYVSDGGAVSQNTVQGLAKAWVMFLGTGTVSTYNSFNIASLTDAGTGSYTHAFTNNMNAADSYSGTANTQDNGGPFLGGVQSYNSADVRSKGSRPGTGPYDMSRTSVTVHGDLA